MCDFCIFRNLDLKHLKMALKLQFWLNFILRAWENSPEDEYFSMNFILFSAKASLWIIIYFRINTVLGKIIVLQNWIWKNGFIGPERIKKICILTIQYVCTLFLVVSNPNHLIFIIHYFFYFRKCCLTFESEAKAQEMESKLAEMDFGGQKANIDSSFRGKTYV